MSFFVKNNNKQKSRQMLDNNNKTAIKHLQRILMQKPKDINVLFDLAYIYRTEEDLENAKKYKKTLDVKNKNRN